jgi:hypothetical protein
MKSSELKKLIKESVKEAIQEELKEILLEAVKTPRVTTIASPPQQPVVEQQILQQPVMSAEEKRAAYSNILGDMSGQFTTAQVQPKFNPQGGDSINGSLPPGEVDMSQIAGLLKK